MNINAGQLPPTLGRIQIMTDEKEITRDNIISVVSQAYNDHQKNVLDEIFLMNYERGQQPILDREKNIYAALGNSGNVIYINPDNNIVIAVTSYFKPLPYIVFYHSF